MDERSQRNLRPVGDSVLDHLEMSRGSMHRRETAGQGAEVLLRTVIEGPFAGTSGDPETRAAQQALHERYLKAAIADSLSRGEAPFASHGFYTQVLDDADPVQRRQGMEAGFSWGSAAQRVAVYIDLGISDGMWEGIDRAQRAGTHVVSRRLDGFWASIPD